MSLERGIVQNRARRRPRIHATNDKDWGHFMFRKGALPSGWAFLPMGQLRVTQPSKDDDEHEDKTRLSLIRYLRAFTGFNRFDRC